MELFIATTNAGKLRDFAYAAQAYGGKYTLAPLPGLGELPEPVEDQETFEGNARLKADFYSRHRLGLWVLADDSGLEVNALGGRPGVRSARYAQDLDAFDPVSGVDRSNNDALLLAMLEQTDRAARFQCTLALAKDGEVWLVSYGTLEGELLSEPEGTDGFGYDPLFFVPELGRSLAQATAEERLRLSHRGRALAVMLQVLQTSSDFGQYLR